MHKRKRNTHSLWRRLFCCLLVAGCIVALSALTLLLRPAADPITQASAEAAPIFTPIPAASPQSTEMPMPSPTLITETPLFIPSPSPVATPSPYPVLRKGASGEDVRRMQEALASLGYLGDPADGQFGNRTLSALMQFQAINGLKADGVAGEKTLSLLYSGSALSVDEAPPVDALILVNRKHTLDANYVPPDLCLIADVLSADIIKVKYSGTQANRTAVEALGVMLSDAIAQGIANWQVSSAYRTYKEQQRLVDNSAATYAKNHPDWTRKQCLSATYNTVAPAGASEHQTGLSFDITVPGVSFTGTPQQKWLHQHCAEYGFIVRYTEEKRSITGFIAESWHIRYVGIEAAQIMARNNWCLEEYLEHMGTAP